MKKPLLNLDLNAWLVQTQKIDETGWSVNILAPRVLIDRSVRTVLAIGGATLLVVMLLIGLMMQRRRHYLDRIAFEAKARRTLEMRVAERTSDLEGLNRRLREEVLEREHAQQELVRAQDDLVQAGNDQCREDGHFLAQLAGLGFKRDAVKVVAPALQHQAD